MKDEKNGNKIELGFSFNGKTIGGKISVGRKELNAEVGAECDTEKGNSSLDAHLNIGEYGSIGLSHDNKENIMYYIFSRYIKSLIALGIGSASGLLTKETLEKLGSVSVYSIPASAIMAIIVGIVAYKKINRIQYKIKL